jgi:uncharacterized protein
MATTVTTPRANARKTTNGFWWADLSSTDDTAAAEFYSRVFGWTWDESPIGEGMVHRDAKLGGHSIAGLDPVMPGSGMPTSWTNFVFVDDIDATVTSAKRLGATVAMEPMDVMGEGHMAVLVDPTGAAFGLWQPGRHTGADAVNQPGTYTWVELATTDTESARRFYGELFGWGWDKADMPDMEYWMATLDGRPFAGLMPKPEEMAQMPSTWATYFGVADAEASAAEVKAAGGEVLYGPMRMGVGVGFGFLDPQGGYAVTIQLDEWPVD